MSNNDLNLAPWPEDDLAVYGEVEAVKMSRIQQLVGSYLHRNWVRIPHVTHQEDADISALTTARKALSESSGVKITPLPYMVKAAVAALKALPKFNASLSADGKTVVLKKYYNIGYAVNSPNGLIVPVVHNADQKSIPEIAKEITEVSEMARTKGVPMNLMSGGCFTISSLGSIGGTGFTPIINAPEVAIMGVTRAAEKPFRGDNDAIIWKTMLPLSLSYDHRVINGADAAEFCLEFAKAISNPTALETA
jgi:pyruvate dehydrogenase E2 component (dihydrolipoamide acetyltransferase)